MQALALLGIEDFAKILLLCVLYRIYPFAFINSCCKPANMIPQVAQYPRPFAQQFGSPGFVAPPFDPIQPPRIQERLPPLPFRNLRNSTASSALAPPHRAFPVDNLESQRAGLPGRGASNQYGGQYNDPSEHMLRRKTPNGTLAAGYDGTPVQWSSKPPALKHVLLPSADSSIPTGAGSRATTEDFGLRLRSNNLGWNYQQPSQPGHMAQGNGQRMNSDPGNWAYLPSINPPSNILNQFAMQPQSTTFYPNNGMQMQIPTVLQPSYQQSPGPTVSNDGGLYGPYWPDGNYVPYRPAAFRDPGYQQATYNNFNFPQGFDFQQRSNPHTEQLPPPFRQPSFNVDSAQAASGLSFSSLDSGPYQAEPPRYITPQYSHHMLQDNGAIYNPITDGSRTPTAISSNRNNNTQFKEKTLSWAHTIYVDLLAFLHQSKKENRQARQTHGFRPYSKNSIYPKPPRQPASVFANTDWSNTYASSSRKDGDSISPQKQLGNPMQSQHRSNSVGSLAWQGIPDFSETKYSRTSQDMPHYVSSYQAAHNLSSSPIGKAKEALEMLTTLCEQNNWNWIDGMLLGGCLAYGLEEYHTALEWYSKIIALDPS